MSAASVTTSADEARPTVFLSVTDQRLLVAAAINALIETPRIAGGLLDEVDRAAIVPDHALGPDVARLGSWVEFLENEERRRGQLVLEPGSSHALPVLSTLGAALIGLRAGATIRLPDRLGAERRITLLAVEPREDGLGQRDDSGAGRPGWLRRLQR